MAYYGALRKRNSLPPNDEQAANEAALKQLLEEQRAANEEEERRRRLEEEKAAYAEKLRRLFEAYGGDADEALTPGASGKKASGEAAYVSTADKNDWDSLKTEASKWGMADAFGMPTGKYWEKVGGKPWWMEGIDAKFQDAGLPLMDVFQNDAQAKANWSDGTGTGKTGKTDQGASGTDTVIKPWSDYINGLNLSLSGGGNAFPDGSDRTADTGNPDSADGFSYQVQPDAAQAEADTLMARINAATTWEEIDEIDEALGAYGIKYPSDITIVQLSQMLEDKWEDIAGALAAAYGDPVLETSGESGIIEEPSGEDVLFSVLTTEQQAQYREAETEAWSYLTEEQRAWIEAGESAGVIYSYLSDDQRQRIEAIGQAFFAKLDAGQQTDFMFLSSGMLDGIDIATRNAILQFLKENGGEISYEDLVDLGVYEPGTLAEGGFRRWLQNLDIGGPAHYGDLLGTEYRLNQYGTNFAKLDQEERMRQGAERTMLLALAAAPVVAAWADRLVNGPASAPLSEGEGKFNLGQTPGAGENAWYRADGSLNPPPNYGAVAGTETTIDLQPGIKLGRYGGYGKNSDFVAEPGSSVESLSLPPYTDTSIYEEFTVLKPIPGVVQSTVAPWGGSIGGGTQFRLSMTIEDLLINGYICK